MVNSATGQSGLRTIKKHDKNIWNKELGALIDKLRNTLLGRLLLHLFLFIHIPNVNLNEVNIMYHNRT